MKQGLTDISYYEMADIYSKIQATVCYIVFYFIIKRNISDQLKCFLFIYLLCTCVKSISLALKILCSVYYTTIMMDYVILNFGSNDVMFSAPFDFKTKLDIYSSLLSYTLVIFIDCDNNFGNVLSREFSWYIDYTAQYKTPP